MGIVEQVIQTLQNRPPLEKGGVIKPFFSRLKFKNQGGRVEPNEKTKLTLHPTFLLAGVFYSLTGDLPFFIMTTLVALEHELAHAFSASALGYRLNKIYLMPYGAVIDGDLTDVTLTDEIRVALAGPLCNLFTALLFGALWWFYPTSYAYTDTACFLSLSVALVNFLPAYPLDGGRILKCFLTLRFMNGTKGGNAERKAGKICAMITFATAFLLLVCFFTLAKDGVFNYTILGFTFFLIVGQFSKKTDTRYLKISYSNLSALARGVEIRRVAVLDSTPLKSVLRYLCQGKYLLLEVYDRNENRVGELRQSEFAEIFKNSSVYTKIGEVLPKNS